MRNEAVQRHPQVLGLVPDQFVTQEMCNEAVKSGVLELVPDQFVTQEMCNEAVQRDPWMLEHVPDQFVTQEMCNDVVQRVLPVLRSVAYPDRW